MSITKYMTGGVRWTKAEIFAIEVERETEQSVWIKGRRQAKETEFDAIHDTWEAAHAFLMKHAEAKVTRARGALEQANGVLGNVKGMKKPDAA